MVRGAALALVVMTSVSFAEPTTQSFVFTERYRDVPLAGGLTLDERVGRNLGDLANFLGAEMNTLSRDYFAVRFDTARSRARLRVGTGTGYLRFNLDTNWHFMQDKARVAGRVELGLGKHDFKLDLPAIDMATNDVLGQFAVEVRLPLYERRF